MARWAVMLAAGFALVGVAAAIGGDERKVTAAELRDQLAKERRQHAAERARLVRTLRHDPTVQEALTLGAVVYGVPRADLEAVAWCESTLRPWARNRSSSASGLFQFLPSTFAATPFGRAGLSPFSPFTAALAAAQMVSRHGWGAWVCRP